eukprot:CAMPEP_0173385134 /NCGR_PEP_ID=MMETSP1356-20130122/7734_1 /TAXON_ID=77927 ORGANISM="Hemiselmis virescens, Strain PCC157" /NCGR_SAMPLE_ID=MMETSP1356 /ASSEMBLY_ACC=CAM_ASM_000847 /LENGTH=101 /DNA_ID=CAMNT_0014340803 /DNA_START=111 /DNA_END=416 /DNA_ORIENTATION=-
MSAQRPHRPPSHPVSCQSQGYRLLTRVGGTTAWCGWLPQRAQTTPASSRPQACRTPLPGPPPALASQSPRLDCRDTLSHTPPPRASGIPPGRRAPEKRRPV